MQVSKFPRFFKDQDHLAYGLLVLTTLFWSGNFVMARAFHAQIPPLGLAFWRWTLALALITPFAWSAWRTSWPVIRTHWRKLLILSVLGVTNFNTFVYLGLQTTAATNGILLLSAGPIFMLAFSWLVFREGIGKVQLIGMLASLLGVLLVITQGELGHLLALDFVDQGNYWILAAVMSWALYSVLLKVRPQGLSPFVFFATTVAMGWFLLMPVYLWDTWVQDSVMPMTWPAVISVFYVACFASILAYLFWNRAVAQLGAARTGHFIHLIPAFGILLSVLFLGEQLQQYHFAGLVLIFGGIYLASRKPATG
ncbi:DMT family transporter [Allopseudospirillum japonicum]|nr:DMT family transporter [Allopseudospirillum japonicum]